MSIQIIKRSASVPLESWGPVSVPLSSPPCQLSGVRKTVPEREGTRTGIWECTPGKYRRDVQAGEVMHILSGHGTFTPDGAEPIEFAEGDTLFCPPMTSGIWRIETTVRKVFVLI